MQWVILSTFIHVQFVLRHAHTSFSYLSLMWWNMTPSNSLIFLINHIIISKTIKAQCDVFEDTFKLSGFVKSFIIQLGRPLSPSLHLINQWNSSYYVNSWRNKNILGYLNVRFFMEIIMELMYTTSLIL